MVRRLGFLRVWPLLLTLAGCSDAAPGLRVGAVEFAAGGGSGQPSLAALADGRVVLTWLDPTPDGHALTLAVRSDSGWGDPRTIVSHRAFFVNWADFPSFVEAPDGTWMAQWLERAGAGTFAYHVRVARSADDGRTWSDPVTPHGDRSPVEHGFVSMVPWSDDGAGLIWLDGRAMPIDAESGAPHGDMQLRFATLTSDGTVTPDRLLDARTCECCQTALAVTSRGLVAAYRDRSPEEVRDIAVVRYEHGAWTEPVHVADDHFVYPGCPVNGPQLAAVGDTVAIAWFTAPDQAARVQAAFSFDGGASFGSPVIIDADRPLGRVDVELLPGGPAVVVWLARTEAAAEIRARTVSRSGRMGVPVVIAPTAESRGSGFPRTARVGSDVVVAWRAVGDTGGVRVRAVRR
jgi:hypothetical protein